MENFDNQTANPSATAEMETAKRESHARAFKRGTKWLGAGVGLMGLSMMVNLLFFHSGHEFETSMYVLTSIGSVCIFKGLVDILGF